MRLHSKPGTTVFAAIADGAKPRFISKVVDSGFGLPWRRIAAGCCLALGIIAAVLIAVRAHPGARDPHLLARIDGALPPLEVEASGVAVNLNHFASGTRKVVVFYSPTCGICREVLPALHPFPSALRLIMISESAARTDSELSEFRGAVFFYDRWSVLTHLFRVPTLPVILLVDESGVIRDGFMGFHERDWIQHKLKTFAELN
jgi:thiol-disulfide isomerase/thioredoxin